MIEYDELKIYRGCSISINRNITIYQPTLDEIIEFGEKKYFNTIYTLTSVPADFKWQLWDIGIDYTKIDEYELFIFFISQLLASQKKVYAELMTDPEKYKEQLVQLSEKEIAEMQINPLQLILGDVDLANFIICKKTYDEDNEQYILCDFEKGITIDKFVYTQIVDLVRKIHGLKKNLETPANERTKMDLIEDARDEAMAAQYKPYTSFLLPLISTMKIKCGLYSDKNIWNMNIGQFLYDIKRIGHTANAERLLQGAYSGFASLKGIDQNKLDIFATL